MNFNREVENSNNIILSFVSFDLDGNILNNKFEKRYFDGCVSCGGCSNNCYDDCSGCTGCIGCIGCTGTNTNAINSSKLPNTTIIV